MGGNVQIGDVAAQRIDLNKIDRTKIVKTLSIGLEAINDKFKSIHGLSIWSEDLLSSKNYLSGSTFHFFDLNTITNAEFVANKRIVGDVDTQVDHNMADVLENFLKNLSKDSVLDSVKYVGFKKSANQFITLWYVSEFDLNVQIDMELVHFKNGEPTEWSRFSHGSAWDDMKEGIKGIFQKYLLRAFQARSSKDVIILPKTERGKEKVIHTSNLAFSLKGLRTKLEPVLDHTGKQEVKNGMLVYRELEAKTAIFETNLAVLFEAFFGVNGNPQEIRQMNSFIGLINLTKKYMTSFEIAKVVDGFSNLLWGINAQGLVKGGPQEDYDTKCAAFNIIEKEFGVSKTKYQSMIDSFYKNYK